jgi:ribosomal-protein-alanine N-acetyltransferase
MTPADVFVINEILAASPQAAQWDFREFVNPLWPGMSIWVAEESGAVVGVVAARTVAGEAEILNLAITPAWRRHGVGRQLADAAMEASRVSGAGRVFLEVRESNVAARAFYESMSFAQTGRRRAYYRDPAEDALVLSRKLG